MVLTVKTCVPRIPMRAVSEALKLLGVSQVKEHLGLWSQINTKTQIAHLGTHIPLLVPRVQDA